jgi:hypothetical protein
LTKKQITLLDLAAFKAINRAEFSNSAWISRDKTEKAPGILAYTRRFNHVRFSLCFFNQAPLAQMLNAGVFVGG